MSIQKRFPADTTMLIKTFLNDKKVDTELYAYLQSESYPDQESGETRVYKNQLPTHTVIATKILRRKSRNTVMNHLNYLKSEGYIIDKGEYYVLPNKEDIYFMVPKDLIKYFIDTLKEDVLKTYIYLGQRHKFKPEGYEFTGKEIAEHIGLDYNHFHSTIKNYIDILERVGLITVSHYYIDGIKPQMKLIGFSTKLPKSPKD